MQDVPVSENTLSALDEVSALTGCPNETLQNLAIGEFLKLPPRLQRDIVVSFWEGERRPVHPSRFSRFVEFVASCLRCLGLVRKATTRDKDPHSP